MIDNLMLLACIHEEVQQGIRSGKYDGIFGVACWQLNAFNIPISCEGYGGGTPLCWGMGTMV